MTPTAPPRCDHPAVTALVIAFETSADDLDRCVRSVLASTCRRLEGVVVVDNGSGPAYAAALDAAAGLDERVEVVRLDRNYGFAGAVNRGVRLCRGEWVLLLNNDTEVDPAALDHLATALAAEAPDCIGVAPKLMLRHHPGVIDAIGNAVDESGSAYNVGVGQIDVGQFDRPRRVFGPCFAAALLRASAFDVDQVGPLDESFFMYYEDIDWNWRANLFGYRFVTAPAAVVRHDHSASTRRLASSFKLRHIERNLLVTVLKNMSTRLAARVWARRIRMHLRLAVHGQQPRTRLLAVAGAVGALPDAWVRHRWVRSRRRLADADIVALGDPGPCFFDTRTYEPVLDLANLAEAYGRRYAATGSFVAHEVASRARRLLETGARPPGWARGELAPVLVGEPPVVGTLLDRVDPPGDEAPGAPTAPGGPTGEPSQSAGPAGGARYGGAGGGPMRVVALTPSYFGDGSVVGGGERFAVNLARAAAATGGGRVEVELVALGGAPASEALGPGAGLTVVPTDLPGRVHPQDGLAWAALEAVAGATVVHVHQAFTRFGQAAVVAAALHGVPVVLSDHGGSTLSPRARRELAGVADAVMAYSRFGASLVGATDLVPGGVDAEWFSPRPQPSAQRRQGFAYVGRLLPHKRVERAVLALPDGVELVVCGRAMDPQYLADLQADAADRAVRFVHQADDGEIREIYRAALAVVLLSEHLDRYGHWHATPELMGLTVLEAMACATPAVVSRTGGLAEFVEDGVTGRVVDDDAELAEVLRELADDPERCAKMGEAARAHVLGVWDLPAVGRGIIDVYTRVLAARREAVG